MNVVLAVGLQLGATLSFSFMAALIRWIGPRVGTGEIVFARSLFALVPLLLFLAWWGQIADVRARNWRAHLWRGITGAAAMFAVFAGLRYLPLADATAIGFAAPLFTVALAAIVLGETVRVYRWSAVAVGFVGVLIMLTPVFARRAPTEHYALGVFFAVSGALLVAIAMIQVRRLTATETSASIVFYFSLIAAASGLLTLPLGWVWPSPLDAAVLGAIGVLGGIGQILQTGSYRHADASVVAPFGYSAILWSLLIGYFWLGEPPQAVVLAGAAIVIGAGLFVIWREHRLGLDRAAAREAETPPAVPPGG